MRPTIYYPFIEPDRLWLRRMLLLYDQVVLLVPRTYWPSAETRFWAEYRSEPVLLLPITETYRDYAELNVERLEKAFSQLDSRRPSELLLDDEMWKLVYLYRDKYSHAVDRLLRRHRLVDRRQVDRRYVRVDRRAADLVVSNLVTAVSQIEGMDTATDQPMPHLMVALDGLTLSRERHKREVFLATAMAEVAVPESVLSLSPEDIMTLRETYRDIRRNLSSYVEALYSSADAASIEDWPIFEQRLAREAANLKTAVSEVRASRILLDMAQPELVAVLLANLLAAPAYMKDVTLGLGVSAILQPAIASSMRGKAVRSDRSIRRAVNSLAVMRRAVLNESDISALL